MKQFFPIFGPKNQVLHILSVFSLTMGVVVLIERVLCEGAFDAHPIWRGIAGLALPILVVVLVEMRQRRPDNEQAADDAGDDRD
jgi:hypothetical protein